MKVSSIFNFGSSYLHGYLKKKAVPVLKEQPFFYKRLFTSPGFESGLDSG